jgi:hypothetical protein
VIASVGGTTFTLTTPGATAGTGTVTGTWYVIATGNATSTAGAYFQVSRTMGGAAFDVTTAGAYQQLTPIGYSAGPPVVPGLTFTRVYQSSSSGWGYPRQDATYKYQHSTASNRGCAQCHVAHGSNAVMTGENGTQFSLNVPYPDGSIAAITGNTSSRLLKVDNRGTCQMCHDPTGTTKEGDTMGNATLLTKVP